MHTDLYPGRYPAVVASYDPASRTCGVLIPGITDGGDAPLTAEIEYPIGDKSRTGANATELEILPGDTVWVCFLAGDPRYPIITGYRCPRAGNAVGIRAMHHAAIHLTADGEMVLTATTISLNGVVQISGGGVTHDGVNIGKTHVHTETGGDTQVPH